MEVAPPRPPSAFSGPRGADGQQSRLIRSGRASMAGVALAVLAFAGWRLPSAGGAGVARVRHRPSADRDPERFARGSPSSWRRSLSQAREERRLLHDHEHQRRNRSSGAPAGRASSAQDLDRQLRVELSAGSKQIYRGPLGDLRSWTDAQTELPSGGRATLTASCMAQGRRIRRPRGTQGRHLCCSSERACPGQCSEQAVSSALARARSRRAIAWASFGFLASLVIAIGLCSLVGFRALQPVLSGSVGGDRQPATWLIGRWIAPAEAQVGDVVTFREPGAHRLITHRHSRQACEQ